MGRDLSSINRYCFNLNLPMNKITLTLLLISSHLGFAQMETATTYAETIEEQDLKELLYVPLTIFKGEKPEPLVKKEP
jgi:hypothetical protein